MKPFFSVLIPTRNRSDLLIEGALKSVLNQTFSDFEVVICDNASKDNTRERIGRIDDPRIRYVYSSKWIPKEHFFEFALRQARGKYSMLFFDDDYLTSKALEKAYNILSTYNTDILVYNRACVYHFPNWLEDRRKNVLSIPPFTGKLLEINSARHLEMIFERIDILLETPMVTNDFCRTSLIQSLLKKYGEIFPHGHMGDYNLACYLLSHTDNYLYFDEPMAIFGHWKQNTSQQLHYFNTTMPEYQEWVRWFTETYLTKMPVKTYLWANCVAATLLDMKGRLNLPFDINMARYFYTLYTELLILEMMGIDTSAKKEECYRVFSSQSPEIRRAVLEAIERRSWQFQVKNIGRELKCNPVIPPTIYRESRLGKEEIRVVGDLHGFDSIIGAGEFFERLLKGYARIMDDSRMKIEYYKKGLYRLAQRYRQVAIVGTGVMARLAARILGSKVVHVCDLNFLLKGKELVPGIKVSDMDALSALDFDCVIITVPVNPHLIEYVRRKIHDGRSMAAEIIRPDEIIFYGSPSTIV